MSENRSEPATPIYTLTPTATPTPTKTVTPYPYDSDVIENLRKKSWTSIFGYGRRSKSDTLGMRDPLELTKKDTEIATHLPVTEEEVDIIRKKRARNKTYEDAEYAIQDANKRRKAEENDDISQGIRSTLKKATERSGTSSFDNIYRQAINLENFNKERKRRYDEMESAANNAMAHPMINKASNTEPILVGTPILSLNGNQSTQTESVLPEDTYGLPYWYGNIQVALEENPFQILTIDELRELADLGNISDADIRKAMKKLAEMDNSTSYITGDDPDFPGIRKY